MLVASNSEQVDEQLDFQDRLGQSPSLVANGLDAKETSRLPQGPDRPQRRPSVGVFRTRRPDVERRGDSDNGLARRSQRDRLQLLCQGSTKLTRSRDSIACNHFIELGGRPRLPARGHRLLSVPEKQQSHAGRVSGRRAGQRPHDHRFGPEELHRRAEQALEVIVG